MTFEKGFDLTNRKSRSLCKSDETQRKQCTLIKESAAGNPLLVLNQPDFFIVTNSRRRHVQRFGNFSNLHGRFLRSESVR